MDSVTQLALGAAVGEASLGRKIGNRAMIWGGICGTIPDLDVFVPYQDPVTAFISHRSYSHSLLILALLTPLVLWIIRQIHPDTSQDTRRWLLLVYLAFATHVLLDCFTAYGTQIFWPVSHTPIMWSTIFIIDPLYSLPLLLGVTGALILTREKTWGHTFNTFGLLLSTLYLTWTVVAKTHVETFVTDRLAKQQVKYSKLLVHPTPINTLLWRILVMQGNRYAEGFYSLVDRTVELQLTPYPNHTHLLGSLMMHHPVQGLRKFAQGFIGVKQIDDLIVVSDLRMGLEPNYAFSFNVGRNTVGKIAPIPSAKRPNSMEWGKTLPWIWQRIWNTPS